MNLQWVYLLAAGRTEAPTPHWRCGTGKDHDEGHDS